MPVFVVVGLGNKGAGYKNNRHNVGFMAVDELAHRHNFSSFKEKFKGLVSEGSIAGNKVFLLKPMTYMNNSGQAVVELMNFYKIPIEDIFVIHDELDLPVGKIKVKKGGGAGGHNGIKSIDAHCSNAYTRIRIGIDHPVDKNLVSPYVLSDFFKDQKEIIDQQLQDISDTFDVLLTKGSGEFTTQLALKNKKRI